MLDILKAVKKVVERFVAGMIPLTSSASVGDTTIFIQSTRRFCAGDVVAVHATGTLDAEVHTISEITDRNTMVFEEALVASWAPATTFVQKLIGLQAGNEEFLKAIYLGDPAVIPQYPAITIDAKNRDSEWLTLESTSEQFNIDITIYIDGSAFYENQYELMLQYVKEIERALFRSFYPLVEPFNTTTLAEDADPSDDIIRVTDEDFVTCSAGWLWFESVDHLRPNRHLRDLGNGIIQLVRPIGIDFAAGDTVIRPGRHIYNMEPPTTQYGTVNKETMLKAAVISVKYYEEVRRYNPFLDPISF